MFSYCLYFLSIIILSFIFKFHIGIPVYLIYYCSFIRSQFILFVFISNVYFLLTSGTAATSETRTQGFFGACHAFVFREWTEHKSILFRRTRTFRSQEVCFRFSFSFAYKTVSNFFSCRFISGGECGPPYGKGLMPQLGPRKYLFILFNFSLLVLVISLFISK